MSTTRQQIADAFERRLSQVGYDRTTLDDIASELRISKKTIYVHYDGKRDIYASLVGVQAAREKMKLAAAVQGLPSYSEKVEAVVSFVLSSARAHINETGRDEWLREYEIAADAFRQANGELLRELIEGGMQSGEFTRGDAAFCERMIAAMTLDYVVMVNDDPTIDHDAELVARIKQFLA